MSIEVTINYVNTPSIRHNFDLGKNLLGKWGFGTHSVHHLISPLVTVSFTCIHSLACKRSVVRFKSFCFCASCPGGPTAPQAAHCEHSTAYLTSRSYSIQLCNYYTIIYTMLLIRSLKDNYKKSTLPSIVVLMV